MYLDEIHVGMLQEVLGELGVERDVLATAQTGLEDQSGDEYRCQHGGDDTDNQCGGETLYRTGTEEEEHQTGYDGGKVTVDNR